MLKVRRILTEILLEVTENQVQMIAKEEYRRFKSSGIFQTVLKVVILIKILSCKCSKYQKVIRKWLFLRTLFNICLKRENK